MHNMSSFLIADCESNIKFEKKCVRMLLIPLTLNLSVIILNVYTLYMHPSPWTGAALGATLTSLLWSWVIFYDAWKDVGREKERYKFLTEMRDELLADLEYQQSIMTKPTGQQNDQ